MVLGLEIGRDISLETDAPSAQDEMPVRASRRIAQLKIKEQADRRRVEEETMREIEEKKESSEKKKRKKQKVRNQILFYVKRMKNCNHSLYKSFVSRSRKARRNPLL